MDLTQLAVEIARASETDRAALLRKYSSFNTADIAAALKDLCVEAWEGDISLVSLSAGAARYLATVDRSTEVGAYADWCKGYEALLRGQMDRAIDHLDRAAADFARLDQPHQAASAQILKLYPLASLNRFVEAIDLGESIRKTLLSAGDLTAVGKTEMNLGNLHWLRDRYAEAEAFFRSARDHFSEAGHTKLLIQTENSLAVALTAQNRFREAEAIYGSALPHAEESGLDGIKAAMESSLGMLALAQGHYDRALDFLSRAKLGYEGLGLPYQLATTERELADAYLELNLAPEAAKIYERAATAFSKFGTPYEEAHSRVNYARALMVAGKPAEARDQLSFAARLYRDCESDSGLASTGLIEAHLEMASGNYDRAIGAARRAGSVFSEIGLPGKDLQCRLLEIESLLRAGEPQKSLELSRPALLEAEKLGLPHIAWRLLTVQGSIFASLGQAPESEQRFRNAISIIERLRDPLPGEEFRASFFADKLEPYWELAGLRLASGSGRSRAAEALELVERARARTLVELMKTSAAAPRPDGEKNAVERELERLRGELNWFYRRMSQPPNGAGAEFMRTLEAEALKRESAIDEVTRQSNMRGNGRVFDGIEPFDLDRLQTSVGKGCVFVEYAIFDARVTAFVVGNGGIEIVNTNACEDEVVDLLKQLRFQIDSLRHGSVEMRRHLFELTLRTRRHLADLYDLLLRPLEKFAGLRRMVIAPHRMLHYVPFPALFDGISYALENREFIIVPSAAAWLACLRKQPFKMGHAVLIAPPDDDIPHVMDEIAQIEPLFPSAVRLSGENATLQALRQHAASADVLHLACHGQFRPDSPLFSALKLIDGRLTVRDAAALDLQNCSLAVLSACDTGLNLVAPGDELMGLIRGFLMAGVPSLVLSQWAVDDEAAAFLMGKFYGFLKDGRGPSTALRLAQLETLKRNPHPYFWASFALIGKP